MPGIQRVVRAGSGGRMRASCVAALLLAGLVVVAQPAVAANDEASWGYALAHELMSPYCPGRTLAACTSSQAAELRQWILLQEAAGASREEVIETLYQRFGAVIRSSPEAEGWGLAAYLVPIVALLVGAVLVAFGLRRLVGRAEPVRAGHAVADTPSAPTHAGAPSDAELERAFEEELRAADA